VIPQAPGDKIIEVDGFIISRSTLPSYILGTDRPDTLIKIKVCHRILLMLIQT